MRRQIEDAVEDGAVAVPQRFERLARLVGGRKLQRLADAHVCVVGLGGVGSWAAEALARSGVGRLTLIDRDVVATTDTNRQLPALDGNYGRPKAEVVAERVRRVNPDARVDGYMARLFEETVDDLLPERCDHVVDAVDVITVKADLIDRCTRSGTPLLTSLGAAGRFDPTQVRLAPLSATHTCPLARALRKLLRARHGFSAEALADVRVVFSAEPAIAPRPLPGRENLKGDDSLAPELRRPIEGTTAFVPPAFGLAAASAVVRELLGLPWK